MNDLIFCAEIGSNWFGNIEIAKYLHMKAKESGATHCKYQFYPTDQLYDVRWEYYDHAKLCELDYDTARILKEHAESIGLGWFASVHTKEDIDFLVDVKAPFIKIKGSQGEDMDLLTDADMSGCKVIVSQEGERDAPYLRELLLYTTLKYPSKFEDIDFNELSKEFYDGFSDHTQGIQASLCAAMYPNIRIFERHFNAPRIGFDYTNTPDDCVSLNPEQFAEMVEKILHIKQTIKNNDKVVSTKSKGTSWFPRFGELTKKDSYATFIKRKGE